MHRLINTVTKFFQTNVRNDDDLIDRLSHRHTVVFLVIFTLVISTTQYVGSPIHCWCPAHFKSSHETYTNNICWVSNTYMSDTGVEPGSVGAKKLYISYYQWVPLALLLQAVLFHMPCLFWRIFSDRSGININNLVEAAETIQNALYPERREKTIRYMIRHLDHFLDYQRDYRGGCFDGIRHCLTHRSPCLACGNRRGNYLVSLYMITKVLYIANAIAQLFVLDLFLGGGFRLFGIQAIIDLINTRKWTGIGRFPRVTWCDFRIHQMGNTHAHTIQCVLTINFFNEKIYLFLWYWLAFVGLASSLSFVHWLWVLAFEHSRRQYVRRHLKIMGRVQSGCERDRKHVHKFTERYLRQDGIFVLKLVANNSTDLVVADILSALWDNYRTKPLNTPLMDHEAEDDDVAERVS